MTDFYATCAAILGKKLPENVAEDSYNILSALYGKNDNPPIREAIVHHSIHGMFAIRQGKWKLILGKGSGGWSKVKNEDLQPGQLYDISQDPEEHVNLYKFNTGVVQRLTSLLEKYKQDGKSQPNKQ